MENISDDKYALSEAWSRGREYKQPFDYQLSQTGQTVLIRRLDMGDILRLGIAEQMDLMSKALMADDKPQTDEDSKKTLAEIVMKSGNFEQMEAMINAVVGAGVIKPKLYATPEHENARQAGLVYLDSVPFSDRMELFGVIFEAEGLAMFREEQDDGVGNVADVPSVQLPPDRSMDIRSGDTEGVLLQQGSLPLGSDGGREDERSGASESEGQTERTIDRRISSDGEIGSFEQVFGDRIEEIQNS